MRALGLNDYLHPVGGDEEKDFDIEKNMGSIMIARCLDAGKRSNYNLTVRVTDGSQAITTQVRAPVFQCTRENAIYRTLKTSIFRAL